MREALQVQMMEFGRTPQQLFRRKHPKKYGHSSLRPYASLGVWHHGELPRRRATGQ